MTFEGFGKMAVRAKNQRSIGRVSKAYTAKVGTNKRTDDTNDEAVHRLDIKSS